jgi:hypothetical protein
MDGHPNRFPLGGLEHRFTIDVRATTSKAACEQRSPRDDQEHSQARQEPIDMLKPSVLYATSGLQCAKEHLNHPSHRVVLNDSAHLFDIANGECRHQNPLDRRIVLWRINFANKDHINGSR